MRSVELPFHPRPHCRAGPRTTRMTDEPLAAEHLASVGRRRIIRLVGSAYHISHITYHIQLVALARITHNMLCSFPVPLHRAHCLPIMP